MCNKFKIAIASVGESVDSFNVLSLTNCKQHLL